MDDAVDFSEDEDFQEEAGVVQGSAAPPAGESNADNDDDALDLYGDDILERTESMLEETSAPLEIPDQQPVRQQPTQATQPPVQTIGTPSPAVAAPQVKDALALVAATPAGPAEVSDLASEYRAKHGVAGAPNAGAFAPAQGGSAPTAPANDLASVYVGNLQWWTTDIELEALFLEFGKIKKISFVAEKSNGKLKYVHAEFEEAASAEACKQGMHKKVINGKPCVVTYASQPQPVATTTPAAPKPVVVKPVVKPVPAARAAPQAGAPVVAKPLAVSGPAAPPLPPGPPPPNQPKMTPQQQQQAASANSGALTLSSSDEALATASQAALKEMTDFERYRHEHGMGPPGKGKGGKGGGSGFGKGKGAGPGYAGIPPGGFLHPGVYPGGPGMGYAEMGSYGGYGGGYPGAGMGMAGYNGMPTPSFGGYDGGDGVGAGYMDPGWEKQSKRRRDDDDDDVEISDKRGRMGGEGVRIRVLGSFIGLVIIDGSGGMTASISKVVSRTFEGTKLLTEVGNWSRSMRLSCARALRASG
ncbi:hypothetical protein CYMTET_28477 [Cymbomonas tetramitiformis]|uniref:RRM domain-containing protein n=1 Tax=Cymbomonas tetramitiformis TaxID=36881 RepID=A0AAE0KVW6_9CHLO|nr:hypothetical protein CYMTET_28477 [Cymbomonas tetramitiformis]